MKTIKALTKPVTEWDEEDDKELEKEREKLPKNVIVLKGEQSTVTPPNTKPLKYTVVKGDTLKKIAEKFSIDYGELVNYMMAHEGSTMIAEGVDISIPRYFIDLSQA